MHRTKLALTFTSLALLTACGTNTTATPDDAAPSTTATVREDTRATVVAVTGPATIDVKTEGSDENATISLINVASPNASSDNELVSCMAPEAQKFLEEQLPAGTEITLSFDEKQTDDAGNTLAAVFTDTETLINTEVVAAGYGLPYQEDGTTAYYNTISNGQTDAQAGGLGVFDRDAECTVPAQLRVAAEARGNGDDATADETLAQIDSAKDESRLVESMLNVPVLQMIEEEARG